MAPSGASLTVAKRSREPSKNLMRFKRLVGRPGGVRTHDHSIKSRVQPPVFTQGARTFPVLFTPWFS